MAVAPRKRNTDPRPMTTSNAAVNPASSRLTAAGPRTNPADPPAEKTGERQRQQKGDQQRRLGKPAIEAVGEDEDGKAQQRRHRSVVHIGPPAGADPLDGEHIGRHAPGAAKPRSHLDVVEVRERDRLEELEGACRHQPGEAHTRNDNADSGSPHEPAVRRFTVLPTPPAHAPWNVRTTPLHGATIVALAPVTSPPTRPSLLHSPAHPGAWSGHAAAEPPTFLSILPVLPLPGLGPAGP